MDLLELLLVLVFFGAPLLGRLLRRGAPQEPQLPPVETETQDAGWLPAPAPARTGPAPAAEGGGWAAGWGAWPGIETEAEDEEGEDEETALAADDRGPGSIHTAEAISLEPVEPREVALRPAPVVVSLEATRVDRKAEHQRFHQRLGEAAPRRPPPVRLADQLGSREAVRRAVLLAEVLGPPRALRELDDDR
ncbi:MAG TPA: hypothetical protein VHG51_06995 [Longimicrobiaceae bacterium]|nr:hypothetical protein [Longimicrobiaceae bacterium]